MNMTGRSAAIGLGAWVFAFLVALGCGIEPGRFIPTILSLACSLAVGVVAALIFCKRYCPQFGECRNALFIFLAVWFAGIYAPISALAANAKFFAWRIEHEAKAASHILASYLAPAVEHLCSSHFAGSIALLGCAYLLIGGSFRSTQPPAARLSWPDLIFGALTWLVAAVALLFDKSDKWHWIAITAGAFLLAVLYSMMRVQWRAMRQKRPAIELQPMPRSVGWVTMCLLYSTLAASYYAPALRNISHERLLLLAAIFSFLPYVAFHVMTLKMDPSIKQPSSDSIAFAVRCGFWSGIAITFVIGGLVMTGVANSLLEKSIGISGGLVTPFALTIIALRPLYKLWLLPSSVAYIGGLLIAGLLHPATRTTHRILAGAYGGAVAWAVSGFTTVLCALNLALIAVPSIPIGEPLSNDVVSYFAQNGWYKLGLWDLVVVVLTMTGGALLWAIESSIVCGCIWAWNRFVRKVKAPLPATIESALP